MKVKDYFKEYDDNLTKIQELNIKNTLKIKSFILGYGLSLLIVLSPILVFSHLFIYADLFNFIVSMLMILIGTFMILGSIFYHKFLCYFVHELKNIPYKINLICNSIVYLLITLVFVGIILLVL